MHTMVTNGCYWANKRLPNKCSINQFNMNSFLQYKGSGVGCLLICWRENQCSHFHICMTLSLNVYVIRILFLDLTVCIALVLFIGDIIYFLMNESHLWYQPLIKMFPLWASWVAQWSKALHHSASCATRDSGFEPRLCHSRPRPGGPWGDAQLA